jgi:hypothetical protein
MFPRRLGACSQPHAKHRRTGLPNRQTFRCHHWPEVCAQKPGSLASRTRTLACRVTKNTADRASMRRLDASSRTNPSPAVRRRHPAGDAAAHSITRSFRARHSQVANCRPAGRHWSRRGHVFGRSTFRTAIDPSRYFENCFANCSHRRCCPRRDDAHQHTKGFANPRTRCARWSWYQERAKLFDRVALGSNRQIGFQYHPRLRVAALGAVSDRGFAGATK